MSEIILPDFTQTSDKKNLPALFNQLAKPVKIDEFVAFTNCGARFIYISSYVPGSKERKAMDRYFIGSFKTEPGKSD